jgi:hypothetical protein
MARVTRMTTAAVNHRRGRLLASAMRIDLKHASKTPKRPGKPEGKHYI